ncbi:helix-turn-helix transcriptional regulator [Herbiconiux sp.]|uniref:helix-turn-helix domain-containing protein n=1 Tax=Herbiconiux sp. TaxID=1871186 RepID=UPI0025BA3098|nr:helix-turn-helix transcriptional regulator [Herbiconiux sp.]
MRVIDVIENARRDADVSQAELIQRTGMGRNTFYKKLRGEVPFNTNDIDVIAEALGCDPMLILRTAAKPALSVVGDPDTGDLSPKRATEKARESWNNGIEKRAAKKRPTDDDGK